ncbi:MAG TPA: hypothetical protein VJ529_00375, partial [Candidatus Bathyarchaeia archaeon]|nr:hypothetical protein [Candidatus Bathyarchaeia archaeon]
MPTPQKNRVIEELEKKVLLLKEQQGNLDNQAREFAAKRDKLNEKVKNNRSEIEKLRQDRDAVNEKVRELKQHRNELTSRIREKIEEIKGLSEKSKIIAKKRPSKDHQT